MILLITHSLLGDFNAGKSNKNGQILSDFCVKNNMILSGKKFLPDNSFTYISDAHFTCTWIDHCICSSSAHNSINSNKILYDHFLSDHHPLTVCFNCDSLPKFHQYQFYDSNPSAHWKTASAC